MNHRIAQIYKKLFGFRRLRSNTIRAVIGICCILLLLNQLLFTSRRTDTPSFNLNEAPEVIVSLATTSHRARRGELRSTLQSLLQQTVPPTAIQVFIPREEEVWFNGQLYHPAEGVINKFPRNELQNPLIQLVPAPDVGPATKFIHVLRFYMANKGTEMPTRNNRTTTKEPAIIICDDDHLYSPVWIETLLRYHQQKPNAAIGFRGWRVREDLKWGVMPNEYAHHVIFGEDLSSPYRVGVLTANEGYLVLPSFFKTPEILDFSVAPENAKWVDDIWMNGHLAKQKIHRYVIPTSEASLDITQYHTLESGMDGAHTTRAESNDQMLNYFGSS
ncbi:hypothetical protein HK097_002022 [Rhizophlyctis rosea]|uniref:Uncharacterized protein n=1 Tax=Rhizophlyctis rosea TaxID=64517 RepID=A0AAD5X798_9FUNG|nr:hypothetical protein HK097_002022 [Rhizophlyctis rosea]